jgi:hypothetical protein
MPATVNESQFSAAESPIRFRIALLWPPPDGINSVLQSKSAGARMQLMLTNQKNTCLRFWLWIGFAFSLGFVTGAVAVVALIAIVQAQISYVG